MQEDSAASWVESDEKRQISAILSDVDMWLSRCRDAIAGPSADPAMPLKDMLSRVRCVGGWDGCCGVVVGFARLKRGWERLGWWCGEEVGANGGGGVGVGWRRCTCLW